VTGAPSGPAPHRPGIRVTRTLLTGFLLIAAFVLSFGALRHRALDAGIIHGSLGLPFVLAHVTVSAHTLAGLWALTLDGLTAVGVLGVRDRDTRDWRAWVALIGGLGLSLVFQTSGYQDWAARAMAAVPPLALAMAIWIFEVPARRTQALQAPAVPEPRPAIGRDGSPDTVAGREATAGNRPPRSVGGLAPADTVSVTPGNGDGRRIAAALEALVGDTEDRNLPDRDPPAKGRDATVTTPRGRVIAGFPVADYAALARQKGNPAKYAAVITDRGLDRDRALALAASKGWPAANGTRREEVPS
jgi:hypothetical protein